MNFIIAAGGTGGHVFPGLAIAKRLLELKHSVTWVGTKSGIENNLVPNNNIALNLISARALRGKGKLGFFVGCGALLFSTLQTIILFISNRPDCVLVMGGYVSAPVGIAAKLLNIKLALHEQNAVPGLANKYLFHIADVVFTAFDNTFVEHSKVIRVGNPVRGDIVNIDKVNKLESKLCCLILGGSQGARSLNQKIAEAWLQLPIEQRPNLLHQVGVKDYAEYTAKYFGNNSVQVVGFIDDIAVAYQWADVVVSRSGAMTVTECLVANLPVAWVPYPYATDNHQYYNAKAFALAANNQSWLWSESQLDTQTIITWWQECQVNLLKLRSNTSISHKYHDANQSIVNCLLKLLK